MIFDCSSKKAYLAAPAVFLACAFALLATWAVMEPAALRQAFDQDGYSVFELATIPFYAAIIPLVWWKCPFSGSRRRRILLCLAVSCVAFMAVAKELDWHLLVMKRLFPEIVGADGNVYGDIGDHEDATDVSGIVNMLGMVIDRLDKIERKDTSVEVSTAQITKAQQRTNRRAGITVVPVGT